MLPKGEAVQLSRLLLSRRIGSRSVRPNAPSRLAVALVRTVPAGASRLGRVLESTARDHDILGQCAVSRGSYDHESKVQTARSWPQNKHTSKGELRS